MSLLMSSRIDPSDQGYIDTRNGNNLLLLPSLQYHNGTEPFKIVQKPAFISLYLSLTVFNHLIRAKMYPNSVLF